MSESSEPFTQAELDLILNVADSTTWRVQGQWNPTFVGQLVRVYLYLGIHPSVLCGLPERGGIRKGEPYVLPEIEPLTSQNIVKKVTDHGVDHFLAWHRPKTKRGVNVPIPDSMLPWLGSFLDMPKPTTPHAYNYILDRLEAKLAEQGYQIVVCPKRFRHTCACLLLETGKMSSADVENFLAISPQVLKVYANRRMTDVAKDLREAGWGSR